MVRSCSPSVALDDLAEALRGPVPDLLNRDDVGFAKRIPFGGVQRTRISSCVRPASVPSE